MYESPEMGKLNGNGGSASPVGIVYQVNYVAVDTVVMGVVAGILFLAIFQIDTTMAVSVSDSSENE